MASTAAFLPLRTLHPQLECFFSGAEDYVLLRMSDEFPDYPNGADVDVLCANPTAFLRRILHHGKVYEQRGFTIRFEVSGRHIHADFYPPGANHLVIRFDLVDSLAAYDKFRIDPGYVWEILAHRRRVHRVGNTYCVPAEEDDLALRFLEYVQYGAERPSKIKHLNFVKQARNLDFLQRIHQFTDLEVTSEMKDGDRHFEVTRNPARSFSSTSKLDPNSARPFYDLHSTCQIPDLQAFYEDCFSQRRNGCFVEVGAFDGEYVSNTSALADLGWTGHYIEPVPQSAQKCQRRHERNPRVTVSNLAIGSERARVRLFVGGPLTTISPAMKDNFERLNWAKGTFQDGQTVEAEQIPLNEFLSTKSVPTGFELLVVDVEGSEWNVLRGFDIGYWRPQMVIVELHDKNEDYLLIRGQCLKVVRYFQDHNYVPVFKDGTNTIYVAREKLLCRRERMDYFLIWGHGLAHTDEIVDCIRRRTDLEIVALHKRRIPDIARFVQDLYACDTVPFEHLRAKTQYLLSTPGEILFILVRNRNAQEQYFGEGPFRHIQCALIKDVKEEVRNSFNPRLNGKRTEDHVIHASDYESQVDHTLRVLGLPPLAYYCRQPNPELTLPYHIEPFAAYRVTDVPLDSLRARLVGGAPMPIEQTPHFQYVSGDQAPYVEYHRRHFGVELTDDHFPDAFDKLIAKFDYQSYLAHGKRRFLVVKPVEDGIYVLQDGVHRAAILKHLKVASVPVIEILVQPDANAATRAPARKLDTHPWTATSSQSVPAAVDPYFGDPEELATVLREIRLLLASTP